MVNTETHGSQDPINSLYETVWVVGSDLQRCLRRYVNSVCLPAQRRSSLAQCTHYSLLLDTVVRGETPCSLVYRY
jgi:hypothetical protein